MLAVWPDVAVQGCTRDVKPIANVRRGDLFVLRHGRDLRNFPLAQRRGPPADSPSLTFGLVACQPGENRDRQTDEPADTAAVQSALDSIRQTFIVAWEAGDAEKIASLWAEEGRQAIPMAPPVRGRDTIEALSKRWFESNPATREATVDTVRDVRVLSEDWAYAYTTWTFRVTPEAANHS
jgi:uncharacterized protein (TIGR02246 family)